MAARQDATESRCDRTVVVYGVQFHEVGQLRVARDGIEESLQHVVQAAAVDDWRGQRGEWCCGGDKARYAVPADGESPGPDQSPLMSNDLPRQENADAETIRVGCFGGRQERRFHEHVRLRGAPDEVAKARVIARKLGGRNGTDFECDLCCHSRLGGKGQRPCKRGARSASHQPRMRRGGDTRRNDLQRRAQSGVAKRLRAQKFCGRNNKRRPGK